jgi:hypothetical protein
LLVNGYFGGIFWRVFPFPQHAGDILLSPHYMPFCHGFLKHDLTREA